MLRRSSSPGLDISDHKRVLEFAGWRLDVTHRQLFSAKNALVPLRAGEFELLLAFAATQLLKSLLFHVSPLDPMTYVLACIALCGAATLASYIPSRRTAAVNPVDALRAE